jgi:hypothetical protein
MKKVLLLIWTAFYSLAAAYSLSELSLYLRDIVTRTYNIIPLTGIVAGNIALSCILLVAIYSIRKQVSESKLIALAYIMVGTLASFSMFIYYLIPSLPFSVNHLTLESPLAMVGALMVALGLSAFVPIRKQA